MVAVPLRLASVPVCGLVPVSMDEANALLEQFGLTHDQVKAAYASDAINLQATAGAALG